MPTILRKDPLILLSDDGERVAIDAASVDDRLGALTGAMRIPLNGRPMWVMPYTTANFRAAHTLHIPLPAPIRHRYKWSGRYKPMAHQASTAAFCTLFDKLFILNDIGTGKTLSALWAADFLMREGAIHKVLILSTLSTLTPVWCTEIFQHFPHRRFHMLHGAGKKLVGEDAAFLIMNHDGLRNTALMATLASDKMLDLVIVDEAAILRNSRTKRYKALGQILKAVPRAWLMTATPTPNNPTDAWAQARLVNPVAVPRFFQDFQAMTMRKEGMFKWTPKPDAAQIVHRALQPAIRFTAADCLDLPPISYLSRHADMSSEQAALYAQMRRTLVAEIGEHTITAANEAVKGNKLLQCACGVLLDDGDTHTIHASAKMAAVMEILESAGGPVVIFAPFKSVVAYIHARLVAAKIGAEAITGETSRGERDRVFAAFQRGDLQVIVAHPATMSHGLTLTASSTMIWFAPVWSNETYEQAVGRLYRKGQTRHVNIVHLESSEIETEMYGRLRERKRMQGLLLSMFGGDGDAPAIDKAVG